MKTLSEVFSLENLYRTHKRCRNSKQHKREVINFELNLAQNLINIRNSILNKTYTIKRYRKMIIYEPKKREIDWLSYKHRIVQNCLCEHLLRPELEKRLIYDNCACRLNKGTDFARNRLKKFINECKKDCDELYFLKCDIKKFFPSLNHEILKQKLAKIFPKDILWLLYIYIDTTPQDVGIPIGNQTSQWFALLYLNDLDHKIKEQYKIKYYIRYMDDLIFIHKRKQELKKVLAFLIEQVKKEKLAFNNKTQINKLSHGVSFLGFIYSMRNNKLRKKLCCDAKKRLGRSASRNLLLYCTDFRDFNEYSAVLLNVKNYMKYNGVFAKNFPFRWCCCHSL